ncbi:DHHC zinc finger domain-containing protein [Capsaspora owczarzaki ATCC 30864]|uniref:Palmitoyltransferase n=1 Tax=Capsaspora owczarzaki (strain ATCC 30864) TaxID=595528 RepID=A0A0D2ULU9_CAPO3|nr:DHHC zinc finger domain-containing protein [Capsaspora owczarzaki ATCC 30864]KJE96061.1 DHHC zinc finger domain-containing protein [Capsaspora owczarzaki ATCC 30864]|eukprot:XP_004345182.1 DHHC zinc finger domain-containing protein [Capsaspora owczarzaki ATCC 30864]
MRFSEYAGTNRLSCRGKGVTGPNRNVLYITLALMVVIYGVFLAFPARYLYYSLSKSIPFVGSYIFLQAFVLLIATALKDPGILPRARVPEREDPMAPLYKDINVNGIDIKLKYCVTCNFFRPPRANHCSICNNCIEGFDHHCPWIANCIGRRNYRMFFGFVLFITLLTIWVLAFSIVHIVQAANDGVFQEAAASVIVGLFAFVALWPVLMLLNFHARLVRLNLTTNEDITEKYVKTGNPFDQGCAKNCASVLCAPRFPRFIKPVQPQEVELTKVTATSAVAGSAPSASDAAGVQMEQRSPSAPPSESAQVGEVYDNALRSETNHDSTVVNVGSV